ncbi:hypothetical protein ES332_D11G222900v1 [Gossypium tomentosum]|uniref:RING-type E3 ubiquitin transferase n=1 Tax=Gossypium tomentosum TaxID=34277 RepID=A0A5D2IQI1_GOSTO|nr:hypothetical protein ES332_D11G222900v1 [Gossypium tomentosum]
MTAPLRTTGFGGANWERLHWAKRGSYSGVLRRRQYQSLTMRPPAETEPCCICQEGFANGDDFHFNSIKQRLVQKNSCPICKKTALAI